MTNCIVWLDNCCVSECVCVCVSFVFVDLPERQDVAVDKVGVASYRKTADGHVLRRTSHLLLGTCAGLLARAARVFLSRPVGWRGAGRLEGGRRSTASTHAHGSLLIKAAARCNRLVKSRTQTENLCKCVHHTLHQQNSAPTPPSQTKVSLSPGQSYASSAMVNSLPTQGTIRHKE